MRIDLPFLVSVVLLLCVSGCTDDHCQYDMPVYRSILIDPGHGGKDPGSTLLNIFEDEIAYDISVRLRELLLARGARVNITVFDAITEYRPLEKLENNRDEFLLDNNGKMVPGEITLKKRIEVINSYVTADDNPLLISIHVNSVCSLARGVSIYYPRSSVTRGDETLCRSGRTAWRIYFSFNAGNIPLFSLEFGPVGMVLPGVRNWFMRPGDFTPAVFSKTLATDKVLVECGNLNNREDARFLLSSEGRRKISEAMARAVQ